MFVDEAKILVRGGHGGNGCVWRSGGTSMCRGECCPSFVKVIGFTTPCGPASAQAERVSGGGSEHSTQKPSSIPLHHGGESVL